MKRIPAVRVLDALLAVRVLGALLLAAAVALHVLHVRSSRARAQGADALRALAAMPALQLGIHAPGAAAAQDFQLCPPNAVPLFLARLAAAEPGAPPKGASLEYGFSLVLTNHVRALLRGVRAPASDELWLSLREAAPEGGDEAFRDWPPALVTGLGALLDRADAGRLSAPVLVRRAGDHGFDAASLADTAASLRHLATLPAERAQFVPAGGEPRDLPAESLAGIAAALAGAEPSELPDGGSLEGSDGTLLLFLDDGFLAMLRAAVPDSAPGDAIVGFRELEIPEAGASPRLGVSAPARVPGLGAILAAPAP